MTGHTPAHRVQHEPGLVLTAIVYVVLWVILLGYVGGQAFAYTTRHRTNAPAWLVVCLNPSPSLASNHFVLSQLLLSCC